MANTVLIIETAVDGHRGFYLRWVAESFLEDGAKVIVAIPNEFKASISLEGLVSDNLEFMNYELDKKNIDNWPKYLRLIYSEFSKYIQFKSLYKESMKRFDINYVFIPFIDHIFYFTSLMGSPFGACLFSGISMRPDFHYGLLGLNVPKKKNLWLKEFLFKKFLTINQLTCLLTLDEPLHYYCISKSFDKVKFLPEPVDVSIIDEARMKLISREMGLIQEKKKILVYGKLTKRKGIKQLINSTLDIIASCNLQLVLAGEMDGDIKKYLLHEDVKSFIDNNEILIIDQFLTYEQESVLFSNAYLSWLGYVDHYRASGVLILSSKYSVPVVATDQGVIGWQVARHKLGVCLDVNDAKCITDEVSRLCIDNDLYAEYLRNSKKAFTSNTLRNAKNTVVSSQTND